MRPLEAAAIEALRYAALRGPDEPILGAVTASELARLAVHAIHVCPRCRYVAGRGPDCGFCARVAEVRRDGA